MSYGLATRICDDPRAAAFEVAREIAGKSPDAIRAAKRMLNKLSVDPGPALLAESVEQQKLIGSANQTRSRARQHGKARAAVCGCVTISPSSEERVARVSKDRGRGLMVRDARRRAPRHEDRQKPGDRSESDNDDISPSSASSAASAGALTPRSPIAPTRIAGGLHKLGVKQGDSVCMLMRNDIAFIEAAYAAMRLGAYGVPVNWHFKPEEINYILKDSGTSVLIAHADMLHQLRDAIPAGVTVLSVPTPPEILANYKIDPDHLATPDFAIDFESWLDAAPAL